MFSTDPRIALELASMAVHVVSIAITLWAVLRTRGAPV